MARRVRMILISNKNVNDNDTLMRLALMMVTGPASWPSFSHVPLTGRRSHESERGCAFAWRVHQAPHIKAQKTRAMRGITVCRGWATT